MLNQNARWFELAQLELERRGEPRFGAVGEITFAVDHPERPSEVTGQLVDFSLHGLRIKHQEHGIRAGDRVKVFFSWGEIATEVAWSCPIGDCFETGLQLV